MFDTLFRALLRLLPEEFRSAYGRDLQATIQAERYDGASRQSRWATMGDVIRQAPALHWDVLKRDAKLAARTLGRRPLALVAAILTMAIGIGSNVAMFAVADAVLLSPLGYGAPEALVSVRETGRGDTAGTMGYLTYVDLRARSRAFSTLVAASQSTATLTSPDRDAERLNVMRVSREYFDMIGTAPAVGRTFLEAEDRPGAARRVLIISDALWRRRFDARPDTVGQNVDVGGIEYRIVGIMPPGFNDIVASRLYNDAELWSPLGYDPTAAFACRTCRHLRVFGRLAPGVSVDQANQDAAAVIAALAREHPTQYSEAGAGVTRLKDLFLGPVRPVLIALWIGVAALWLVACGNVAHLMLLRASEREQEISIRTALGVTRTRLVRQFLTEAMMLASAGGIVGFGVAWAVAGLVAADGPAQIPRLAEVAITWPVALAGVVLTIASGLVFSALPIAQVIRTVKPVGVHSGTRGTASRAVWRSRSILVSANVALAMMLLVGSGLLVRSLTGLLTVQPGFTPSGVLTMEIWASGDRFRAGESEQQIAAAAQYYDDVRSRVGAVPGVMAAGATTLLPLGGNIDGYGFHIQGRLTANPQDAPTADRFAVTPGYFEAMRIRAIRGRVLAESDSQNAEAVVVINDTAARTLFAGTDPLGQRVMLGPPTAAPRTIVGVVNDVSHQGLDVDPRAQVYAPHAQWAWAETALTMVVRTNGDPMALAGSVREAVRSADRSQAITRVRSYDSIIAGTTGTRRFAAAMLTAFALTSLTLAIVGLYGSVGVMVAQRRRELGVRLALGASTGGIRGLVLRQGLRPVAIGLVIGAGLTLASVRGLETLLYGVTPSDPLTLGGAVALLAVSAVAACLLPAYRASLIDPALTLRD